MGRIPRALSVAPILLGLLGCSTTRAQRPPKPAGPLEEHAEYLVGPWYDPAWKAIALTIERTGPSSFRLIHESDGGESRAIAGNLIVAGDHAYLDLKSEKGRADDSGPHHLLKVAESHAFELGFEIGAREKQQQFHHSPFKSYKILRLVPLAPAYLEKHPDALRHKVRTDAGDSEPSIIITARAEEIAGFLQAHGEDSGLWVEEHRWLRMVRK